MHQSSPVTTTPPWEARRSGKSRGIGRRIITWTFLIALIALIGYGLRPRPIEVELGMVKRGPLTVNVVEEGKTRIRNRYVVSANVSGQMHRVVLKPGDSVKAGETLLTDIEPALSPLLDPRAKAQAEARVQVTEAALDQARQSLEMSKTSSQFAKSNWERIQHVKDPNSVSITDRDNAERDYLMKQREMNGAEFALKVAQYETEQAKAALLQITTPAPAGTFIALKAPVTGRVLRVMQESAVVVTPGTQILEIGDPEDMEIEAEILSRDAVNIKPGASVSVEQWGEDQPLQARVRRVEPAAFTKVSALGVEEQRVYVLSDLVNPPPSAQALGDRYRVEVRIAVWHGDNVLLAPSGALFREGSEWKTYRLANGHADKVTLDIGRTDGRMSEVLRGLGEGDELLLHPPDTVKEGVAVTKREGA